MFPGVTERLLEWGRSVLILPAPSGGSRVQPAEGGSVEQLVPAALHANRIALSACVTTFIGLLHVNPTGTTTKNESTTEQREWKPDG